MLFTVELYNLKDTWDLGRQMGHLSFQKTYIIKFYIYLCSKFNFLSFRAIFCFTNPDYRLIRTASFLPLPITPD
jgi:hypothetical protein